VADASRIDREVVAVAGCLPDRTRIQTADPAPWDKRGGTIAASDAGRHLLVDVSPSQRAPGVLAPSTDDAGCARSMVAIHLGADGSR
jgi:hypothetical protein